MSEEVKQLLAEMQENFEKWESGATDSDTTLRVQAELFKELMSRLGQ